MSSYHKKYSILRIS